MISLEIVLNNLIVSNLPYSEFRLYKMKAFLTNITDYCAEK